MKCQIMIKFFLKLLIILFPFVCPSFLFAAWQVVKPETAMPREPFFQAGAQHKPVYTPSAYASVSFPNQYAKLGKQAPVYAISISGSLKENLERIMRRYHWKVVWKSPNDYNFDGRVTGSTLPNVVEKLLQPFPLQAVMYMSNRTVMIVPRFKS